MCVITANCFRRREKMNWTNIWIRLFGTRSLFGLDMGFWIAMAAVALLVVLMNVVFWGMKPGKRPKS